MRQTINFTGTKNAPIQAEDFCFFGFHVILDAKTTPFLGEDFFFGLHLISDTKTALILGEFPEKVRTRQSFCARHHKKEGTLALPHKCWAGVE